MGKKLVILGFLLSFAFAIYVFMTRETSSIKERINRVSSKEPRVVLEEFIAYRYDGDQLKAKITAHLGEFFEPNVVVLEGEVNGRRIKSKDDIEEIRAESATAYFKPSSLTKMLDPSQANELERAELSGFVEVMLQEHQIITDYAEFIGRDKSVRSSRPVRVEGPGRTFIGESGFVYQLVSQILSMPGKVKGEVAYHQAIN
ncbi:MAG: hypothetical protein FJ146_03665 [Deltaproteobacteria bacterium]|nr:hypothetical protein [Deltaproteobacteria bacterium]